MRNADRVHNGANEAKVAPGTTITAFYDPGSNTAVWSVAQGSATITPTHGAPVTLTAGKEVEVTPTSVSAVAAIGKANARGGVNRKNAGLIGLGVVGKNQVACALKFAHTGGGFSVKPTTDGWLVSVKSLSGKARGASSWFVTSKGASPRNAAAKKIAAGCR